MIIIAFLLIISLIIAIGFVVAYIWAVRSGQYDDLDSPSVRMFIDSRIRNPGGKKSSDPPIK